MLLQNSSKHKKLTHRESVMHLYITKLGHYRFSFLPIHHWAIIRINGNWTLSEILIKTQQSPFKESKVKLLSTKSQNL